VIEIVVWDKHEEYELGQHRLNKLNTKLSPYTQVNSRI